MARKVAAEVEARILELRRGGVGLTEDDIAKTIVREGGEITPSGVHRVLSRHGLARPRGTATAATATAPAALAEPPPSGAEDTRQDDVDGDVPARLRRALAALERAASAAEGDKDVGRMIAAQRAITAASGLLAKATPPPPVDPDARPDMLAAAKRGRERMHTLLDRMLAGGT